MVTTVANLIDRTQQWSTVLSTKYCVIPVFRESEKCEMSEKGETREKSEKCRRGETGEKGETSDKSGGRGKREKIFPLLCKEGEGEVES